MTYPHDISEHSEDADTFQMTELFDAPFDVDDAASLPDDLTQLMILITGPKDTPYAQGLWRLHIKMPIDYPKNPPKATFKTRIYHPNVDEKTGAICLETLKRDWDPKLTLRDILITISCLLIQPNPDSALNATAGALIQENFEAFSKQARLMTKIHAPIPRNLRNLVDEAQRRGEETMSADSQISENQAADAHMQTTDVIERTHAETESGDEVSESEASKENDASLSPSPILLHPPILRNTNLGKRPLAELTTPTEGDDGYFVQEDLNYAHTSSEVNIVNGKGKKMQNAYDLESATRSSMLARSGLHDMPNVIKKKLMIDEKHENEIGNKIYQDNDEKENLENQPERQEKPRHEVSTQTSVTSMVRPSLRKVSNVGSARGRIQPRVGIRRL